MTIPTTITSEPMRMYSRSRRRHERHQAAKFSLTCSVYPPKVAAPTARETSGPYQRRPRLGFGVWTP